MTSTVLEPTQQTRVLETLFRDPSRIAEGIASDGVVDWLRSESVSYEPWLDISSRERLRESLSEGVSQAILRHAVNPAAAGYVRRNIYDPRRAGWQVLCPLRRDSIVIDFGCGLGALSRSLARNVGTVVGIDACYERLMIHAAVNREQQIDNVQLLFGNHEALADIEDNSVDGFVLNGVLEWVPERLQGNPYQNQLDFLRECRRIVKPDGWLYVGIENRYGFRYFLGRRDDHTQMLFSSLLPRWLADAYSRIVRGKPYRTYTYSPKATQALVARAGFAHTAAYGPLPDYRDFDAVVPLDARPSAAGVARRLGISKPWKQAIVETSAFYKRFVPCLSIVGSQPSSGTPQWLKEAVKPPNRIENIYVKYDQASIWHREPSGQVAVRELALSSEAQGKLRRIGELSHALRLSQWCPQVLKEWQVTESRGFTWADRRLVPGKTLDQLPPAEREKYLDPFFAELHNAHGATERVAWSARSLTELFEANAPNADRDVSAPLMLRIRSLISDLERSFEKTPILMHGDSKAANVVAADGKIELIDWEWSCVVENVGYDVLKFAWSGSEDPSGLAFQGDETVVERSLDDATARRYLTDVHPDADWKKAVLAYWINRLARTIGLYRYGGMPPEWNDQVFRPWTDSMSRIVGI